ncbi:MAG: hypothetical protein WCX82_04375 [archaeon]|jgi:predicted transcriptional regulator of viral defense system
MDLSKLKKLAIFTNKDLKLYYRLKYPEVYICRNKTKIITIEKGKYTLNENPFCYATQIINPSYISFLSALNFYEYSTQIPLKITVAIKKQKKELSQIKFIKINTKYFFGYNKIKYGGFDLFIADKEKLLLDCVSYQNFVQVNELTKLIKDNLDKEKIVTYLNRINNLNLIRRTGYLLELVGIDLYEHYTKINKINNYILLNKNLKKSKNYNHKWKLNINEEIYI